MSAIDPSQSSISPNFAPFVYEMLSRGLGAAQQPYVPYTGQRYAGAQPLETTAFTNLQQMGTPGAFGAGTALAQQAGQALGGLGAYTPTTFNTGLGAVGGVQDYMSPYMTGVADVAAREARRESDISRTADQARFAQAGAFGGSRQGIVEAERQRNLGQQIGDIYTKGLQSAYDRALEQRLKESGLGLEAQKGTELSRQFGAKQGLEALQQQVQAGQALSDIGAKQAAVEQGLGGLQLKGAEQQRGIAQLPLDFGYEQFKESERYPYQQATYLSSLLQGMPVKSNPYQYSSGVSPWAAGLGTGAGALDFYDRLKKAWGG